MDFLNSIWGVDLATGTAVNLAMKKFFCNVLLTTKLKKLKQAFLVIAVTYAVSQGQQVNI